MEYKDKKEYNNSYYKKFIIFVRKIFGLQNKPLDSKNKSETDDNYTLW